MHHLPSLHIGSLSLAINLQDVRALRFILAGEFSYDPCSQVNHHAFWGWSNPPGVCVCVCVCVLQWYANSQRCAQRSVPCVIVRNVQSTSNARCTAPRSSSKASSSSVVMGPWGGMGFDGLGLWSQCGDGDGWSQIFCWWFCWFLPSNDRKIWDGQ